MRLQGGTAPVEDDDAAGLGLSEQQIAELQRLYDELAREVAEHRRAEEEWRQQRDHLEALLAERTLRLRALTTRLAEAEEQECHQVARELHDQVGQDLTAVSLNLKALQLQLLAHPGGPHEIVDRASARLADSLALIKRTTQRIRNVMDVLRPPALEEYGLVAALCWHTTRFTSRTNIPVSVAGDESSPRPPTEVEIALFRIAQEALTNVARHARATHVRVTVEQVDGRVRMVVADDGIGFDPGRPETAARTRLPVDGFDPGRPETAAHTRLPVDGFDPGRPETAAHTRLPVDGFDPGRPETVARTGPPGDRQPWGLLTMAERAEAVGGRLRVESAPGNGTRVIVEVAP